MRKMQRRSRISEMRIIRRGQAMREDQGKYVDQPDEDQDQEEEEAVSMMERLQRVMTDEGAEAAIKAEDLNGSWELSVFVT
ncbi:hypothetical protein OCS_02776 [Ophiocordyceps sinensis CO18]|uniref:Uncharacterized protein n=1 Tax=Ophiocordyceps sinensis (strain Co18 / CGMCC 3.14243) TaxID=911162 RepID=T5AGG7_OPHSC|nr:hypothetical protein OCS_02776 [Ophiocordyceps sinensis CO18]